MVQLSARVNNLLPDKILIIIMAGTQMVTVFIFFVKHIIIFLIWVCHRPLLCTRHHTRLYYIVLLYKVGCQGVVQLGVPAPWLVWGGTAKVGACESLFPSPFSISWCHQHCARMTYLTRDAMTRPTLPLHSYLNRSEKNWGAEIRTFDLSV